MPVESVGVHDIITFSLQIVEGDYIFVRKPDHAGFSLCMEPHDKIKDILDAWVNFTRLVEENRKKGGNFPLQENKE